MPPASRRPHATTRLTLVFQMGMPLSKVIPQKAAGLSVSFSLADSVPKGIVCVYAANTEASEHTRSSCVTFVHSSTLLASSLIAPRESIQSVVEGLRPSSEWKFL